MCKSRLNKKKLNYNQTIFIIFILIQYRKCDIYAIKYTLYIIYKR